MHLAKKTNSQQGFGLLEVLIASLVVLLGLMVFIGLQTKNQARAFDTLQLNLGNHAMQDLQARLNASSCALNDLRDQPRSSQVASLLNNLQQNWHTEFFGASASRWQSNLELESSISDEQDLKGKGHWLFKAELNYTSAAHNSRTFTQIEEFLVVRYLAEGCPND